MNIFNVLFWCLCSVGGGLLGVFLYGRYGIMGMAIGCIVGFILSNYLLKGIVAILSRIETIIRPLRPSCRNGKCTVRDYEVSVNSVGLIFRCKCGDRYVHENGRFMEILPDGSRRHYKKRTILGKWIGEV